ncbi:hypothetical protein [Neobacillus sp. YIM B06451]|uniref:hypothetical protein n=1 Tax=Neobacillus sp. YIM B06451 TaxID=3070994 RepID=UPI00292DD392|nr:hypothetical protein [Neobacillus sp. YIM B06451]
MATDKFDHFDKKMDFHQNLGNYNVYSSGLAKLGEKTKVFSNISYMRKEFSDLKASGRISKDDFKHDILEKYINDATGYLYIKSPSIHDVSLHYACCEDFNTLVNEIKGEGKGDGGNV